MSSEAENNRKMAADREASEKLRKFAFDVNEAVTATQAHAKAQRIVSSGEAYPAGRILSQALAREIWHYVAAKPEAEHANRIDALVGLLRSDIEMAKMEARAKTHGIDLYS